MKIIKELVLKLEVALVRHDKEIYYNFMNDCLR